MFYVDRKKISILFYVNETIKKTEYNVYFEAIYRLKQTNKQNLPVSFHEGFLDFTLVPVSRAWAVVKAGTCSHLYLDV